MQRHDPPHFYALRDALERRHVELLREVEVAELARRAPIDRTDVGDREDDAIRLNAGDIGEAEEDRDVVELRQVEASIAVSRSAWRACTSSRRRSGARRARRCTSGRRGDGGNASRALARGAMRPAGVSARLRRAQAAARRTGSA